MGYTTTYGTQLYFKTQQVNRSTPVETLHTILLGPYKYLLKTLIPQLTAVQKRQVLSTFNYSGIKGKVLVSVGTGHTYLMERKKCGLLYIARTLRTDI